MLRCWDAGIQRLKAVGWSLCIVLQSRKIETSGCNVCVYGTYGGVRVRITNVRIILNW